MRTVENDNDKAKKYFGDPEEKLRAKNAVLRGSDQEEGNALVEKLKAQTEENKEKNRLDVERKTFENDQVRWVGQEGVFLCSCGYCQAGAGLVSIDLSKTLSAAT